MRAAVITAYQEAPRLDERQPPEPADGRAVVELSAAALNPADLAVASGSFPAGSPSLPYVPGIEGVGIVVSSGRFAAGTRVWASGRGLGIATDGTFADRFAAADDALVEVPEAADDALAAAFGVAGVAGWMPLAWAAPVNPGDSVLVLGATGAVGTVAVQAAKLLGAGRVVGVGRDPGRLERLQGLGADAVVPLGDELRDGLVAAFDGTPPPAIVVDALWGAPLEAALGVAAPGAKIVHLGQSAGPAATMLSGLVRGKQLQIIGYSNFAVPQAAVAEGYTAVVGHAAAGRIRLDVEQVPLADVAGAWERQRQGGSAKLVLVP
ncbi:MAG: zinc-binding alcohol dehydrogenase family protein [Gaiellales bacterium]